MPTTNPYDSGHATRAGYRDVSPAVAAAAGASVRLVDVREPHEYTGELGHLPGAELVPLATVTHAAQTWDRARDLILICRSGARSGRAAEALVALGFQRVMNLAGGMLAYTAAHLPVAHT